MYKTRIEFEYRVPLGYKYKTNNKYNELGKKLLCKCGNIANATYVTSKKAKTQISLYCPTCMPKGKKVWAAPKDLLSMAKAGLIDTNVATKIRAAFARDDDEFDTTETELIAIAAPAIIGLRSHPVKGYNNPAATGMPKVL